MTDGDHADKGPNGDPAQAPESLRSRRAMLSVLEDQKRAMDELRAARVRLDGLLARIGEVIWSLDVDTNRLLYISVASTGVFGRTPEEFLASPDIWFESLHPEDVPAALAKDRQARERGEAIAEYRIRRPDGEVRWIRDRTVLVRDDAGRAIRLDGIASDITEQKRSDELIQRHVTQLQSAFMHTVEVATTLSEMRDPYTAGHEKRVASIAVAIGAELGLEQHQRDGLRVAGFLHDIGKITIPAEILAKPAALSPIERQLVMCHAQSGYEVLKKVEFPWPVAMATLQHHERMDGSGYPSGLKGEAIILEARVLAVADVVESMSSHRPYRPSLGIDKALAEIERGRGIVYDADVANACLRLFREMGFAIPDEAR